MRLSFGFRGFSCDVIASTEWQKRGSRGKFIDMFVGALLARLAEDGKSRRAAPTYSPFSQDLENTAKIMPNMTPRVSNIFKYLTIVAVRLSASIHLASEHTLAGLKI
jgi:hypothetical protein